MTRQKESAPDQPGGLTNIERRRIAKLVTTLFNHWKLSSEQVQSLLGFHEAAESSFESYETRIISSNEPELLIRINLLLAIHKTLRRLFGKNPELLYSWMTTTNRAFMGVAPVEFVRSRGVHGLQRVLQYLEQACGR